MLNEELKGNDKEISKRKIEIQKEEQKEIDMLNKELKIEHSHNESEKVHDEEREDKLKKKLESLTNELIKAKKIESDHQNNLVNDRKKMEAKTEELEEKSQSLKKSLEVQELEEEKQAENILKEVYN